MATVKKTMVKKAKDGMQAQPKPKPRKPMLNYDRLQQGVDANDSEGGYGRSGRTPSSGDSAFYRAGYSRGLRGGKEYPNEPNVQRMGRWEGQNDAKAIKEAKAKSALKKKMKNGGSFPDLSGDKKVTQKDVLIAKGVLPKPAKKSTGKAKNGKSMKAMSGTHMMPDGSMMKNSMMKMGGKMKSGGKMKVCKNGC